MSPIISLAGIVVGLILLMYLAYKGHSIIWVAPVCAIVVALLSGLSVLDAYLGDYIEGVAQYIILWFPAFFLGAVYGNVLTSVVNCNRATDKLGENRGGTRPGLDNLLIVGISLRLNSLI